MAKCTLEGDALIRFAKNISLDIDQEMAKENPKPFNLKDYMNKIYDFVMEKNGDPNLAAAYAKAIPAIVLKYSAIDSTFRKYVKNDSVNIMDQADLHEDLENDRLLTFLGKKIQAPVLNNAVPKKAALNAPLMEQDPKKFKESRISQVDEFEARPRSFLTSTTSEVKSIDSRSPEYNVPLDGSKEKLKSRVERLFINLANQNKINNEGGIEYPGVEGGVFLTAFSDMHPDIDYNKLPESRIQYWEEEEKTGESGFKTNRSGVEFILTDKEGKIIHFNDNDEVVSKEDGNPVVLSLRGAKEYGDPDKQVMPLYDFASKLARETGLSFLDATKLATEIRKEEEALVRKIREFLRENPNEKVTVNIVGGSTGYINVDFKKFTKCADIKNIDDFNLIFNNGKVSLIYKGTTDSIQVFRTRQSKKLATNLANTLIYPTIRATNNKTLSIEEKADILKAYYSQKDVYIDQDLNAVIVKKEGVEEIYNITDNLAEAEITAKQLSDSLSNYYLTDKIIEKGKLVTITKDKYETIKDYSKVTSFDPATENIITDKYYAEGGQYYKIKQIPAGFDNLLKDNLFDNIENLDFSQGVPRVTFKITKYNDYIISALVTSAALNGEGKVLKLNPYFVWNIPKGSETDEKINNYTPYTIEVPTTPTEVDTTYDVNKTPEIVTENLTSEQTADDIFKNILDNPNNFKKTVRQKLSDKTKVKERLKETQDWYNSTDLKGKIPLRLLFTAPNNTEYADAVATLDENGITLWEGSDETDIYHEAWHGFTQYFITPEERKELYDESRNIKGSFVDFTGKQVNYKDAEDLQLEEDLAEGFREYRLSNGKKVLGQTPVRNKFFQRIYAFLEWLFGKSTYRQSLNNIKAINNVREYYEKLTIGKLGEYKFDPRNVQFKVLKSTGIKPLDSSLDDYVYVSATEARLINQSVDSLFAKLAYNLSIKGNAAITYNIMAKESTRSQAYKYVEATFKEDLKNLKSELEAIKDEEGSIYKKQSLENNIRILTFAISNFGNTDNIKANEPGRGVIGYHRFKSEFISFEDKFEEEIQKQKDTEGKQWDKSGNEQSMSDLMPIELQYIFKSISSDKKNRLNYDIPISYNLILRKFTKTIVNNIGAEDIYKKLVKESEKFPPFKQLIGMIGAPNNNTLGAQKIWNAINSVAKVSEVLLKQLTLNKITRERNPNTNTVSLLEKPKYELSFGESFGEYKSVQMAWEAALKYSTGKYVTIKNDARAINIKNIISDFPTVQSVLNNKRGFLSAIGINFSDNEEIDKKLNEVRPNGTSIGRLERLHEIIKTLANKNVTVSSINDIIKDNTRINPDFTNEYTNYKELANLELQYSDLYSNFSKTNAEGNKQYSITQNNSMLQIVNYINEPDTFQEMVSSPATNHFDTDRNPFTRASIQINSLYDLSSGKKRTDKKGNPVKISVDNLSGITLTENDLKFVDGISLAKVDKSTKLINDINTLLKDGIKENLRHADKVTSYAEKVSKIYGTRSDGKLYVDTSRFINNNIGSEYFANLMMRYVIAEHDRINIIKKAKKDDPILKVPFYNLTGKNFVYFDGILSDDVKKTLLSINTDPKNNKSLLEYLGYEYNDGFLVEVSNTPEQIKLREDIKDDIKLYFTNKTAELQTTYSSINTYDEDLLNSVKKEARKNSIKINDIDDVKNAIIRSFFANALIHNTELTILFYGDIAQYGHAKKELSKRIAGAGSTGPIPRTDDAFEAFINSDVFGGRMLSKKRGIDYTYSSVIDTGAIADDIVDSVYYDKYTERAKKDLENRFKLLRKDDAWENASKKEKKQIINDQIKKQYKPYLGMNAADGQGYCTFDIYRILSFGLNMWTEEQEKMYIDIVEGRKIDSSKVTETFPVLKLQAYGPLATKTLPIFAFHKFSLLPLVPTMIAGSKLEKLHEMMMDQKKDYVVFESGSKISIITNNGKNADVLYKDGKIDTSLKFASNPIWTGFIKNQLNIQKQYKEKSTFASQMRKIGTLGLYDAGVPSDFMPGIDSTEKRIAWKKLKSEDKKKYSNYNLNQTYKKNLNKLQEFLQLQLLSEINWKIVNGKPQGNMKDLLDLIEREFIRDGRPDYDMEFLNVDKDGKLIRDLSFLNNSSRVEKMLIALAEKRLIRQKVTGEPLVQVSSSMFEKIDHEAPKYKLATEEELKEFGSGDLPFYDFTQNQDGTYSNTTAAGIKVSLQGPFKNLLLLEHNDGKPIKTRNRLNAMIRNEKWLNTGDNRKLISTISVRIPVGERNFLDFFQIYEFLPEESGPIVVLPKEIVAKNGSDFDIDKLMSNFMSTVVVDNTAIFNNKEVSKEKAREYFDKITSLREERKVKKAIKRELKPVANIPQNLISGIESYGSLQEADPKVKETLGNNPTSIDMIEAGFRTRTTRSKKEMDKYNIKVGDIIKHFGKSKDGTTKEIYAEVTAIHPKGTPGFTQTWKKEGWTKEGVEAIKRFKAGAAAIEFKVISTSSIEEVVEIIEPTEQDFDKFYTKLNVDAYSNAINDNLRAIFERPENFLFLTNASSNFIFDPIVENYKEKDIKKGTIKDFNLNHKKEKTKWFNAKGEKVDSISPTTSIEPLFDLETHALNNVGKDVVGITASGNGIAPVLIDVGAYMNPFRGYGTMEEYQKAISKPAFERSNQESLIVKTFRPQLIRLPHNYVLTDEKGNLDPNGKYKAPDLSRLYDAYGNNPNSEVGSQVLNGGLEVAKNPWLAGINITKETSPTVTFMKQVGIPADVTTAMLKQPLVSEYIKLLAEVRSAFAQYRGYNIENPNFYRIVSRGIILNKFMKHSLDDVTGPGSPTKVNEIIQQSVAGKFFDLTTLENHLDSYNGSAEENAIFLHYLELEDMAKANSSLTRKVSMDTATESTMFSVLNKNVAFEELYHENAFPKEVIDRIKNDSQISSFFNREFISSLYAPLFELRNNQMVNFFLTNRLKNGELDSFIEEYGDLDKTASAFLDTLTNYIFQNTLYGETTNEFDNDLTKGFYKGITATSSIEAKKTIPIVNIETKVIVENGNPVLYYNKNLISQNYSSVSKQIYPTFRSYQQYVFEKAYQEYLNPKEAYLESLDYKERKGDLVKTTGKRLTNETDEQYKTRLDNLVYNDFIAVKSRFNTFNFYQLFESSESYADIFNSLKFKYSGQDELGGYLFFNILEANESKRSGVKNLKLKTMELTGDDLNEIHENIKSLASERNIQDLINKGVIKIKDTEDIAKIADFFRNFTYYSFLQSGIGGKGAFGIQPLGLQPIISRLMIGPVKAYAKTLTDAYNIVENANKNNIDYSKLSESDRFRMEKGYNILYDVYKKFQDISVDQEKFRYTDLTTKNRPPSTAFEMVEYSPNVFLYNTSLIKNVKQAESYFKGLLVNKNASDYVFVINGHEGAQIAEKQASIIEYLKNTGAEVITIPVRTSKSEMSRFTDKDLDNNKNLIDLALAKIEDRLQKGKKLVMSNMGYGQAMIGFSDITGASEANTGGGTETFVHLSKELYKKFGYLNNNFKERPEFDIEETDDQTVRDFLSYCLTSGLL